ncbi:MAG: NADH-quinone oxidoreductase subunit H [Bernardetiaceae bacterium]
MLAFFVFLPLLLIFALLGVYAERKLAGFIQDRLGPTEVGPYGLLQTLADVLKLIQKEDLIPISADRWLYKTAPFVVFTSVLVGFSVVPLSSDLVGARLDVGLFFLLAFVALDIIGILMAGWGSESKYALFGAVRAVAQMISYELPLGLSVLGVVILCGSLDLQSISFQQGIFTEWETNYLFGLPALGVEVSDWGGVFLWNVVRMPVLLPAFVVFFIASLAEANRAPFDLPEAESELIAGFLTEYSGFRWSIFMLAEYGMMLLVSMLGVVLFWGSWNTPLPNMGVVRLADYTSGTPGMLSGHLWGAFWLISKSLILIFVQMWVRWSYPRLRIDQLMRLCWQYLIPASLLLFFLATFWKALGQ